MPTSLTSKQLLVSSTLVALLLSAASSLYGLNHDQAIFLQAALREVSGQRVYQDYFIPQGAVAGKVLALFLRLAPTAGWGMVAASMALNAGATVLVWGLILLATGSVPHAFVGSFLTGVWFLPVFGSFYNDHLSYFFLIAALYGYLKSPERFRIPIAAFLLAVAYHTKQSVGAMGLAAWVVSWAMVRWRELSFRDWAKFSFFSLLSHLLLLWNAHAFSQWKNYLLYAVQCPLWYASHAKAPGRLFLSILFPWNINPYSMIQELGTGRYFFYPLVVAVYFSYYVLVKSARDRTANQDFLFILCFAVLSTLWGSAFLGRYHGQLFFASGIMIGLVSYQLKAYLIPVLMVYTFLGFLNIYSGRGPLRDTSEALKESSLRPIQIEQTEVSKATSSVLSYLTNHSGVVATLGLRTYLIGPALGRATVNPSVYYQRELTIPWKHPEREEWVQTSIEQLESKQTKYLILDEIWRSKNEIYMPELMRYLKETYELRLSAYPLQIWEHRLRG